MSAVGLMRLLVNLLLFVLAVSAEGRVIRFNTDEIKEIVKLHNDLRRSIYNAANMRELTWNEGLAIASSEWASGCEYISRPDNQWGQNLNYFHGRDYHNSASELFRAGFQDWENETMHYDYRRYRFCGRKNVCSYVQLIAADVQELGCSMVKCPRLSLKAPYGTQQHAKFLACFYSPWVDITHSEVFIPERRCGACPPGTTCVDDLCSARFHNKIRPLHSSGSSTADVAISGNAPAPQSGNSVEIIVDGGASSEQSSHSNSSLHEHRRNPESFARRQSEGDAVVIFRPDNRVVPFPGKKEFRVIRRIERYQNKMEKRKKNRKSRKNRKRAELVETPEKVVDTPTSSSTSVAAKSRSELTSEEQFFTIQAHNVLRREQGARDLSWSAHLERWAKYVIRCETEYPGPISCYTNFGKANQGQKIYNVVYQWGAEGNDLNRPLRYGCRTPYDKSLCNHNVIVRNKGLTQVACAAKNCGRQRQLTCLYNTA